MKQEPQQSGHSFNEDIPTKLTAELRRLYDVEISVPDETDRAILGRAREQLAAAPQSRRWTRWMPITAAAASIALIVCLTQLLHPPKATKLQNVVARRIQGDIDGNGLINVLDAFRLARHIEQAYATEPTWDVNGDGQVDQLDVDRIAMAAVRLEGGSL